MLFKDWMPVTSWESALSSQPQKALKVFVFMKKQFPISLNFAFKQQKVNLSSLMSRNTLLEGVSLLNKPITGHDCI